jgi:hypothetical protein
METLRDVGRAIWKACNETKQVIEVVVWDALQPEPKEHLPLILERAGSSLEVQKFVETIHQEVSLCSFSIQDLKLYTITL